MQAERRIVSVYFPHVSDVGFIKRAARIAGLSPCAFVRAASIKAAEETIRMRAEMERLTQVAQMTDTEKSDTIPAPSDNEALTATGT